MAAKRQSTGKCCLCGNQFGRAAMTRHLSKCGRPASPAQPGKRVPHALHIFVEGAWSAAYWLHLAAPATAPLSDLDYFLRQIWLECCGHMSAFEVEGTPNSVSPIEDQRSMRTPLSRAVDVGTKFVHRYDFGSTTRLRLRVVGFWARATPENEIQLLARNDPHEVNCQKCGTEPATLICTGCDGNWLCEGCSESHECGEEYLLPAVNSPRAGVCGYTG
jgi:hypothetical protein